MLLDQFVDGGDIFPGEMFALIFAPQDFAQLDEVVEERCVIIGPLLLVAQLRLNAPATSKFLGAHLALFALCGDGFPNVLIAHAL